MDPVHALIERLTTIGSTPAEHSFVDRLACAFAETEATRLLERLENVLSGHLLVAETPDLASLIQSTLSDDDAVAYSLTIVEPAFRSLSASSRSAVLELASTLLTTVSRGRVDGRVQFISASILTFAEDPACLAFALSAASHGMDVRVMHSDGIPTTSAFELTVGGSAGAIRVSPNPRAAGWFAETIKPERAGVGSRVGEYPLADAATISIPAPGGHFAASAGDDVNEIRSSVTDLFGDFIALRDLQPRSSSVRGLSALRSRLGLASPFVPRKNDQEYATVVSQFIADLIGSDGDIVYIGDTVFNDGSVICNLDRLMPGRVFGFLCNEKGFGHDGDFIVGPVYFGRRWTSLTRFAAEVKRRGLTIGRRMVGLFDLDQTVYAAKGRNDSALYEARWEAINTFLSDVIPSYKYDQRRAEAIYRQFDQDEYHRVTRDNMDYVVLLVLAVAAGLCDVSELDAFAADQNSSIAAFIEFLHQRAIGRRGHEEVERVLDVIRAVYHNTLAGDQTPCKEFRK